jgi:DNA-binding response OmpR family regulator
MNQFQIHIFCQKKEICSLIKKKLMADGYDVDCTNLSDPEKDFLDKFDRIIDCIILDKDIDKHLREKIRNKFPDIPIICLPALDSDMTSLKDVTYISEPLKLSELSDIITEIRLKKEIELKS